ncbi:hypothetical protein Tco_1299287 [Tanacetum coccineum]
MEQMLLAKQDEAGLILTDEQNDFLFTDASRMEEVEELSANICLMARIQPANFDSDEGPIYDSAFLSEVQTPSTSYVNPLFAKDTQKQKYLKQPKIINNTIGDDQINSNIIFDKPNGDVNSGSFEYDNCDNCGSSRFCDYMCSICVCVGYVILDNQSIERDRLNGIGFVLNFVKFISFTFGDKEMILVIEAVSR